MASTDREYSETNGFNFYVIRSHDIGEKTRDFPCSLKQPDFSQRPCLNSAFTVQHGGAHSNVSLTEMSKTVQGIRSSTFRKTAAGGTGESKKKKPANR